MAELPKLTFREGWDLRDEVETPMKGYRSDGVVLAANGKKYPVYFIDPVRLQQELEAEIEAGTPFWAEPGLIVVPEVTREAMENAIKKLWHRGYFCSFDAIAPSAESAA